MDSGQSHCLCAGSRLGQPGEHYCDLFRQRGPVFQYFRWGNKALGALRWWPDYGSNQQQVISLSGYSFARTFVASYPNPALFGQGAHYIEFRLFNTLQQVYVTYVWLFIDTKAPQPSIDFPNAVSTPTGKYRYPPNRELIIKVTGDDRVPSCGLAALNVYISSPVDGTDKPVKYWQPNVDNNGGDWVREKTPAIFIDYSGTYTYQGGSHEYHWPTKLGDTKDKIGLDEEHPQMVYVEAEEKDAVGNVSSAAAQFLYAYDIPVKDLKFHSYLFGGQRVFTKGHK